MTPPPAVILAGGMSRRMGRDKAMVRLGGRSLLARVVDRMKPQCDRLAINANAPLDLTDDMDLPVLPDVIPDRPGPLAGILTAMDWAAGLGDDRVVTVSSDAPFLPGDLVPSLLLRQEDATDRPVLAASGGRVHPVCALWPVTLRDDLRQALQSGTRKVMDWTVRAGAVTVDFPATDPDPFFNINTPEDLARAETFLKDHA